MSKSQSYLLKTLYGAAVLAATAVWTYAAFDDASMGSSVTTGTQFTATAWNAVIANIRDLNSRTIAAGTANFITKYGVGGANISNSQIFDTGTNIGIGTTSPASKLSIETSDTSLYAWYGKALSLRAAHPAIEFMGTSGNKSGWIAYDSQTSSANPEAFRFFVGGTPGDIATATNSLTLKSNGNVGVGSTMPQSKFESSAEIASQAGRIQRDFLTWNTVDGSNTQIHIKTNIRIRTDIMYRISIEGYNYGRSASINSDTVGYTYSGWSCVGSNQNNNYANGVSISTYCSSDGYVVVKLDPGWSNYYLGFSASAWFVNPTGTAFKITGTVYHQNANL